MGELIAGMMWFDGNPKKPLAAKVEEAAEFFRNKYHKTPDACMVNRAMLTESEIRLLIIKGGKTITIRAHRSILPGNLWIGVEEKESDHANQNTNQ